MRLSRVDCGRSGSGLSWKPVCQCLLLAGIQTVKTADTARIVYGLVLGVDAECLALASAGLTMVAFVLVNTYAHERKA